MCAVSNIGDYWKTQNPWIDKVPSSVPSSIPNTNDYSKYLQTVSRAEFDKLKSEVEELKKLLQAAKAFDEKTGQPHCEVEEKVGLIKAIAEALGVDLKGVLD